MKNIKDVDCEKLSIMDEICLPLFYWFALKNVICCFSWEFVKYSAFKIIFVPTYFIFFFSFLCRTLKSAIFLVWWSFLQPNRVLKFPPYSAKVKLLTQENKKNPVTAWTKYAILVTLLFQKIITIIEFRRIFQLQTL